MLIVHDCKGLAGGTIRADHIVPLIQVMDFLCPSDSSLGREPYWFPPALTPQ